MRAGLVGITLAGCAIFAGGAGARSLLGAKGEFSTLFYDLKYDPTRACFRPNKPFSKDGYAWKSYQNDSIRYMDCIKEAASSDVEYAVEVISEGYKREAEEFIREAKGY